MKRIMMLMGAVMLNCICGGVIAGAAGLDPSVGAVGLNAVGVVMGMMDVPPAGVLRAGVYTEIWTGELVKYLRRGLEATFLDGIPDNSSAVDKDVIHLVDVGVEPDVLINNTTYPIDLQSLEDADIPIGLDKFQTKVTPITDDELYAISYDKISSVKERHGNAINDAKFAKAAHALCAQSNTAKTPVLSTSGSTDPSTGRKKITPKDIVAMKRAMDKLQVPAKGRRLVLCSDHVNDLLEADQNFKEQYNNINRTEGTVGRLYGFDIYEFANNPVYTTAGVKKSVNATPGAGEFQCSFAFYTQRVFKATGSTKMYWSPAETDPEYQRNKVNFRHYFICMPKKADAGVVIYSGYDANGGSSSGEGGSGDGGDQPTIILDERVEDGTITKPNSGTFNKYFHFSASDGSPLMIGTNHPEWMSLEIYNEGSDGLTYELSARDYPNDGTEDVSEKFREAEIYLQIAGTDVKETIIFKQQMAAPEEADEN